MSENKLFATWLSRIAGREPRDEVDEAEIAAELKGMREQHPELVANLAAATSKVAELTEQLDKANVTISEFKAAAVEKAAAELDAEVEAALKAGQIAPPQAAWAKENADAFRSLVASTEPGAVGPPTGTLVSEKVRNAADTIDLSAEGDRKALNLAVRAYMAEHEVSYGKAYAAVVKAGQIGGVQ